MQRGLLAHGVAVAEVLADVARDLFVEALRQLQVLVEQLEGPLHGALRPPQGDSQGEADGEQEQGVEVGELLEAHGESRPTTERRDRRLFPFGYRLMTKGHYRASGRYTSIRLRPPCLARYSASSACLAMLLISRSGVSSAMPQLKVQRRSVGCAG